ncbi:DUF7114 family protein [Salinirubrum litoreum]|uniref:Uncharacterized protein n=1 Tax=Salinirubrum litoreum TaxID=1126234 RepID=A0ABD5RCJ4_9EURY|nr:hypothetical protein [Salinirubrum litoreum]
MDEAVLVRDTARETVADIEPAELGDALTGLLSEASVAPGALTLLTARALDPGVDLPGIAERAVGVQLIYDGLRITRLLAHTEPWTADDAEAADIAADLDVLSAVVLVSRGFYLLARTETAGRAVAVVQQFGRDQTLRQRPDADVDLLDRNLEEAVFELAVATGATAVGGRVDDDLLGFGRGLADGVDTDELPPAESLFSAATVAEVARVAGVGEDRVPPVADDG